MIYRLFLTSAIYLIGCCIWLFPANSASAATGIPAADEQSGTMPSSSAAVKKVSLRLNWKHQFEFAGFYAALEKGFYRARGLDVELKEYIPGEDIVREVIAGESTYGLSNSRIIEARLAGKPIQLLANYLKRSSLVVVARAGIRRLDDLKGKRLMIDHKDLDSPLLWRAFQEANLTPGRNLDIVPYTYDPSPFLEGKVDAMAAFVTNELFEMEKSGIPFGVIDLAPYLPASGDVFLFTTGDEMQAHPERTLAFVEASKKGWEYAFSHPDEVIDLILAKYSRRKDREALLYEAAKVRERVLPVDFPLGAIYEDRIETVATVIAERKHYESGLKVLRDFVFAGTPSALRSVNLTPEEQAWLRAHPVIRVGIDPLWAPVEFFDESGEAQGISINYLRRWVHP